MKRAILLSTVLTLMAGMTQGANTFTNLPGGSPLAGTSPSGRYAVGYDQYVCDASNVFLKSYIYDSETSEMRWVTDMDENDPSKGGQFSSVTDDGCAFGTAKDMEHVVTWVDEMFGESFSGSTAVAAIWDAEGNMTPMPYGSLDVDDFARQEDGTFGVAISGDGTRAIGYAAYDNMGYTEPLMWEKGADGVWTLSPLPAPYGAKNLTLYGISGNGSVIIGGAYVNEEPAVVCWKDGRAALITGPAKTDPQEFRNISALGVSENGRFVAISIDFEAWVYDTANDEYRHIKPLGEFGQVSQTVAVANNGDVYGNYNSYPMSRPFIYMYDTGRVIDLGYYLNLCVPGFDGASNFSKGSSFSFRNVSPDGRRFSGNTSSWGGSGWMMEIDAQQAEIPELPVITYAFSRNPSAVTLRWNVDRKEYDGRKVIGYNVYHGGNLQTYVEADSASLEVTLDGQPDGYPEYSVEAVLVGEDGSQLTSPVSDPVKVAVTTDFSMPLREFFDGTLETNYWMTMADYGDPSDTNMSIFYQAGVEEGNGLYSNVASRKPYSFSLVSRPFDARGEKSVKISFGFIHAMLNDNSQVLDNDFISVDISTDSGDSWKTMGKWALSELSAGNYCFKTVDVSDEVAGKMFRFRLHRDGDGSGMYISGTDNIVVSCEDELDAPDGLGGTLLEDGSLALAWKAPSGAYNLNHIGNLRTMNMSFGNEGREIICVNRFTAEDLRPYAGKQITSVSALINYLPYYEDVLGIHASAVIYEDGEIVREQNFGDLEYNACNVVDLDNPLEVDGSKELMVGIRIFDYDDWQWPAVAAVADDYVPGKTDLYTEDGGKTWLRLSDAFDVEDIRGHCLWDITAHITDDAAPAEIDYSAKPFIYSMYRDAEALNVEAIDGNSGRFIDKAPVENVPYTISMQSARGENSELSESFVLMPTGIDAVSAAACNLHYDAATGMIEADGETIGITVYDMAGHVVAAAAGRTLSMSGQPAGVYVIAVRHADGVVPAKLVVR